eukprot:TRINITY_DN9319_c0_g1_i1.p1 TRINITY_DN9319_c0_g1~~TRINITY_DN9319_c0_g1_i1.p1  ORF type:complete len:350 (+),score=44.16 TRINITY_DN9319_c0_g1_i1:55-1104(+)
MTSLPGEPGAGCWFANTKNWTPAPWRGKARDKGQSRARARPPSTCGSSTISRQMSSTTCESDVLSATTSQSMAPSEEQGLASILKQQSSVCSSSAQGGVSTWRRRSLDWDVITVTVKTPGDGNLGLRLKSQTRIGPLPSRDPDAFEAYWGEGAEQRGPSSGRMLSGKPDCYAGRVLPLPGPLKALLAQRIANSPDSVNGICACDGSEEPASLKELVEAATGVPVHQQKLTFGLRGPLESDSQTLEEAGLRDGSVIALRRKSSKVAMRGPPFKENPLLQDPKVSLASATFLSERSKALLTGVLCQPRPDFHIGATTPLRVDTSMIGKKLKRLKQISRPELPTAYDDIGSG